jgi:hypothetical protein
MIRAHQPKPGIFWDGKIATIFSTGGSGKSSAYASQVAEPCFAKVDLAKPIAAITPDMIHNIDYSKVLKS